LSASSVDKAADWVYRGLWKIISDCFRVPELPPTLPVNDGESLMSFHPSRGYLAYLKFYFWIALVAIDVAIFAAWLALFLAEPELGALLAVPALIVAVVPDVIAYIAIHLRYDTLWYVMSERSLRCRRGIWVILEHTITFENVQNVHVKRGPVQHLFGISDIIVETAGAAEGEGGNVFAVGNKTIMEGIDNPQEIRERVMERIRASKGTGLGIEPERRQSAAWRRPHVEALRDILALVRQGS
jgi:membrane protein YdbS with pleckstrin-like domain